MGNYRFIHPQKKEVYITLGQRGMSPATICKFTGYSRSAFYRLRKLHKKTGKVSRKPIAAGGNRVLRGEELDFLEGHIERTPDIYLRELQEALWNVYAVDVDTSTIQRSLRRRGYTRKKLTRAAVERNEELRADFRARISLLYDPHHLVFVDESACNRHTCRRTYGWAVVGDRARQHDFFVRGKRYSILPAISLHGVIYLDILSRSWDGEQFRAYLDGLLSVMRPFPASNSVLIMDNASVHHFEGIREMVEARGCRLEYLPPYSPDYNPIEEGFSALKYHIRSQRDEVLGSMSDSAGDPYPLLWNAVYSTMIPQSIAGWYRDAGYLSRDDD